MKFREVKMRKIFSVTLHVYGCLLSLIVFMPCAAWAKDTLNSVLAQTAKQEMVALEYREIKHMIFLQKPIELSGRMFLAGEDFVLEQLQKERLLLTVDQHRLRLYMPSKHIRHSKMMTSPMIQKQLKFFKPLMSGNQKELERMFNIQFSTRKDGHWVLLLKPKKSEKSIFSSIYIEGKEGKAASYTRLDMSDGNRSEWFFSAIPASDKNKQVMQMLMQESKG